MCYENIKYILNKNLYQYIEYNISKIIILLTKYAYFLYNIKCLD
jgi:hypothetical protein